MRMQRWFNFICFCSLALVHWNPFVSISSGHSYASAKVNWRPRVWLGVVTDYTSYHFQFKHIKFGVHTADQNWSAICTSKIFAWQRGKEKNILILLMQEGKKDQASQVTICSALLRTRLIAICHYEERF